MNSRIQFLHSILKVQISQSINSNALLLPVRHVEEQNIRHNTEQDPQFLIQGSSTLSTTNTNIPQPPIQLPTSRNYGPPPQPESDTYTSSTSQQPSFVNDNIKLMIL